MLEFVSGSAILRINQNVPTIDSSPPAPATTKETLTSGAFLQGMTVILAVSNWGSAVKILNLSVSV